jgi:hypothetical protein
MLDQTQTPARQNFASLTLLYSVNQVCLESNAIAGNRVGNMTSPDISILIEMQLLGLLEWHSLECGREIPDVIRECIEIKLRSQASSLWISKRLGGPPEDLDIYKCYNIAERSMQCIGLVGEPNPKRISRGVIEEMGLTESREFSSTKDLFLDYQKSLDEGFRKSLYPGIFPENDGVYRATQPVAPPVNSRQSHMQGNQANSDVIVLKPYRHIDDNWDPDAVK